MEVTNSIQIFEPKYNKSGRPGTLLRLFLPYVHVVLVLVIGVIWATSAVAQGVGGINAEMRYSSNSHNFGKWNAAKAWEREYDVFQSPHEAFLDVRAAPESRLYHKQNGTVAPDGWIALGQDAGTDIWQVATESVLRGTQGADFLMDVGRADFHANGNSVYAPATFAATESVLQKMQFAGVRIDAWESHSDANGMSAYSPVAFAATESVLQKMQLADVSMDTGKDNFGTNGMTDPYSPATVAATESVLLPMLNLAAAGGYDQTDEIAGMLISGQTPSVGMFVNNL